MFRWDRFQDHVAHGMDAYPKALEVVVPDHPLSALAARASTVRLVIFATVPILLHSRIRYLIGTYKEEIKAHRSVLERDEKGHN